jgi:hypothetical protein
LRLLEIARENNLDNVADLFRHALEDEALADGIATDPEFKRWLEAVDVIYRWRDRAPHLWDGLTRDILYGIRDIKGSSRPEIEAQRLVDLLRRLTEAALLPAERELKRLAEELVAQKGLPYESAYAVVSEQHPRLFEELGQQTERREEGRRYYRQYGPNGTESGPNKEDAPAREL